jgi:hypothetical protein
MNVRQWLHGPLLGAALGLPILGGGGRLAMRGIAVSTGAPGAFTGEGTLTVLLLGAASGFAGGAIYAILAALLPRRRSLRDTIFAIVLCLLTLRGLNPVTMLSLALFMPPVVVYGVLLEWAWHRRTAAQPSIAATA